MSITGFVLLVLVGLVALVVMLPRCCSANTCGRLYGHGADDKSTDQQNSLL
jgi:hypothetical protein